MKKSNFIWKIQDTNLLRRKSSYIMQDIVFRRPDIVDSAAENMPATKIPDNPGTFLPTSITKYGSTWSILFTVPAVNGSHFAKLAYMTKPMRIPKPLKSISPAT